jgi:hypothetical protein
MPTNKALIVLQENSGRVPLPGGVSADIRDAIFAVVDRLIETIEDVKSGCRQKGDTTSSTCSPTTPAAGPISWIAS